MLEYELEGETSISSTLPLYTTSFSSPLPPLLSSPLSIDSPVTYNISQINLHEIIQQQQEQLAAIQVQIQALLTTGGEGTGSIERGTIESNIGSQMEVAKPAIFNGEVGRVGGFVIACRLYLRIKMREVIVEE